MDLLLSHQSQFLDIYSMCSKGNDPMTFMKKIQTLLVSLKTIIMQEKNGNIQKCHFSILISLYKLIPYTRDVYGGMSERDLSYWMLFIWNYHFPVPTAQCIYKMVLPIENNPPFGSWRDIKALCGVIRKYSEKGEDDPFIETCISMMNHQLDVDYKKWLDAYDEYTRKQNTVYEVPKPNPIHLGISLVCKWIPREHSAYHWLFTRCTLQWMRTFSPHYLTSCKTKTQYEAALRKGSKEYRHVFTRLSKAWDILEIKQCKNKWDSIQMTNVPMIASMKQQQAFLNIGLSGNVRNKTMNDDNRKLCAEKFALQRLTNHAYKKHHLDKINPLFIDMGYFIQQALRAKHTEEIKRIENMWTHLLNQIPDMPYFVPILDTSMFYRAPKRFFEALGHACLLAMKSSKSILMFDSTIHYISFTQENTTILSILSQLKPIYYEHHIGQDFHGVAQQLKASIEESKMTTENISDLKWVFFVDGVRSDVYHILDILKTSFSIEDQSKFPRCLFWLSGTRSKCFEHLDVLPENTSGPELCNTNDGETEANTVMTIKPILISGSTNYIWTRISQIPAHILKIIHPYDFVLFLVNQERYNAFGDYFKSLLMVREPTVP